MERWTAWAMDQGVKLPYEFISVNRGIVIVNKLLSDSGSSLTVTAMMKSFARTNPLVVYKRLVREEKIAYRDLVKLGWSEIKQMTGYETVPKETPLTPAVLRCEMVFQ